MGGPINCDENLGMGRVGKENQAARLEKGGVGLSIVDQQSNPLGDMTNQVHSPQSLTRKWKKLAQKAGKTKEKEKADNGKRRMSIDPEERVEARNIVWILVLGMKKIMLRWLLGSNTTGGYELPKLELSWA
nr:hypothetical protein CFP56_70937 [Quercus suber]POF00751.1 hypothetical protein CFP56_73065 [Quercus suber]